MPTPIAAKPRRMIAFPIENIGSFAAGPPGNGTVVPGCGKVGGDGVGKVGGVGTGIGCGSAPGGTMDGDGSSRCCSSKSSSMMR